MAEDSKKARSAKDVATSALMIVAFGGLVVVGMRGMEWLIPSPAQRVIVCMADEIGKVEICRTLEELQQRKAIRDANGR